ncbi:MAG: peptidylprolyl isomerase [Burkholderiaceae bacterium]|nr:peptidylprolyl isomerase [Burkholderiaceae bacterium]
MTHDDADGESAQEAMAGDGYWVTLRYRLHDSTGEPIEELPREVTYLHGGYGEVFAAIESAVEGKQAGETVSIYLEPDKTFGDYDASLVQLAARSSMPEGIEVGMSLEGLPDEPADETIYTVTDIAGDTVVLDGNHPLAGMALRFDIEVMGLRLATPDEVEREAALRERGASG